MSEDNAKLNAFIERSLLFQGAMTEFKNTTERRLNETQLTLRSIELELKAPRLCGAHESMLTIMSNMKNGAVENKEAQKAANVVQLAENVEVQRQQKAQDTSIRDLQEGERKIIATLSPADAKKIDLTLKAAIGSIGLWILTYTLKYFFGVSL